MGELGHGDKVAGSDGSSGTRPGEDALAPDTRAQGGEGTPPSCGLHTAGTRHASPGRVHA